MEKYIKKPVVVNAERFDIRKAQENRLKYYPMVQDMYDLTSAKLPNHRAGERFYLKDMHHSSVVHDGDYIVQGNNGQFYIVDKGSFELGYQPIDPRQPGFNKFPNLGLTKEEAEAAIKIVGGIEHG
ncbi:hypothetical protein [Ligilactobacillus acidipiscis]|uniref:Uncharacterized protein n=1 Tax=Ligilactobacillus acidipiscis TaxID=89059 RepID=A0A0R2KN94_9LACO|nr:hypothetical protein [Ligilactobacillus acidipiscis]KRN88186.1 hypothetical protein IV43_GL000037 [Ligilactobacillus acidipiscis]